MARRIIGSVRLVSTLLFALCAAPPWRRYEPIDSNQSEYGTCFVLLFGRGASGSIKQPRDVLVTSISRILLLLSEMQVFATQNGIMNVTTSRGAVNVADNSQ